MIKEWKNLREDYNVNTLQKDMERNIQKMLITSCCRDLKLCTCRNSWLGHTAPNDLRGKCACCVRTSYAGEPCLHESLPFQRKHHLWGEHHHEHRRWTKGHSFRVPNNKYTFAMSLDTSVQTTSTLYTCVSPLSHGSHSFYPKPGNVKDGVAHLKAHEMCL